MGASSARTFQRSESSFLSSLAVLAVVATPLLYKYLSSSKSSSPSSTTDIDDEYWLAKAHQLRQNLSKPPQSNFCVVCILLVQQRDHDDNADRNKERPLEMIVGTNDEPSCNIGGALCAERAAFLQLRWNRFHKGVVVRRVYIVSDANVPIPPGMLCREYMYGHEAHIKDILLQSQEAASPVWTTNLKELYPFPGLYLGQSIDAQLEMGQRYGFVSQNEGEAETLEQQTKWIQQRLSFLVQKEKEGRLSRDLVHQVWAAALDATRHDHRDDVHAIRYGAAAALVESQTTCSEDSDDRRNIRILSACQKKALEYGASQDAVSQLLAKMPPITNAPQRVWLLAQVDQFGIPHGPYAAARSLWMEHGYGRTQCLVSTMSSQNRSSKTLLSSSTLGFQLVPVSVLAPFVPEFRE